MASADAERIAIVTGSSGRMAHSIVEALALEGFQTVAIDRVSPRNDRIRDLVRDVYEADMGDPMAVAPVLAAVEARYGRVDLLVNCAGSFWDDDEVLDSPGRFNRLFTDNVASAVWMSHLSLPLLRAGSDALVVNIASTDGVVSSGAQSTELGVSHDTIYAASKGAVVAFTRALAMAWSRYGIRVNAICPTITRTAMTDGLLALPGKEAELALGLPLGRICEPEDVARGVVSLIPLTMTTGHLLPVDGGYLCL